MTGLRLWLRAAGAVLRRDWLVFLSYRTQAISRLFNVLVTVAMFYYISRLVTADTFSSSDDYFAFVVVGLVITQVVNGTLGMTPVTVRGDLLTGTLERLIVSPFGVISGVIAMLIFPTLVSLVSGAAMIVIAALVFGLPIEASTVGLAIPVGLLVSIAFAPFTLGFIAFILAFKQALPGAGYVIAVLALIAGLYFPVSLLPGWISWTAEVQPFTPAVDLLRHLISGVELREPAAVLIAKLIGFTVVLVPLSLFAVSRAVEHGRRRGSLIEY